MSSSTKNYSWSSSYWVLKTQWVFCIYSLSQFGPVCYLFSNTTSHTKFLSFLTPFSSSPTSAGCPAVQTLPPRVSPDPIVEGSAPQDCPPSDATCKSQGPPDFWPTHDPPGSVIVRKKVDSSGSTLCLSVCSKGNSSHKEEMRGARIGRGGGLRPPSTSLWSPARKFSGSCQDFFITHSPVPLEV